MLIDRLSLSQDPRVPPDERRDITRELTRSVVSHIDPALVREIRDDLDDRRVHGTLSKAFSLEPYGRHERLPRDHSRHHTSILTVNEFGLVDSVRNTSSRWLERRGGGGFDFLRYVSTAVDLVQAIILTRQRQVRSFLQPERDGSPLGFRFVREDGEKLTDRDKPAIARLEKMLLNSGDIDDYFLRKEYRRLDLDLFVTAMVGDSLAADSCPIELTYTSGGKVSGWHNIDFESVRLCTEDGYEGNDKIAAVQLFEGTPYVAFRQQDIIFEIRNPRTELTAGGYGLAETEVVFSALAGYLDALTYNHTGISRSALPRGVMTLIGEYEEDSLTSFQRQVDLMCMGARQRHKFPIVTAKQGAGAVWTPIDKFDEMFFAKYIILRSAITCAVYGIDPSEVNLDGFTLKTSAMSGDNTEEKLASSRDKGLVPLLGFVVKILNILTKLIDRRYRLEFVGLHNEDEKRKAELENLSSTWNEIRASAGKEPTKNEILGEAPCANSDMMALYRQQLQMEQQEAGEADVDDEADDQGDVDERDLRARKPSDLARPTGKQRPRSLKKAGDFLVVIERGIQ